MAGAEEKRTKRLALVVHGLGEQGPGETLDNLAGGLWGDKDDVRVTSDIRSLQEDCPPDKRKLGIFPCHVRRYSDKASPCDPHTTFAEVYWADISQADQGVFGIFYGLIRAILGLGHIVRAGAKQYFGDNTLSSWIANLIPYLLHGPVAAVNAALAIGVVVLLAATRLFAGNEGKLPDWGIDLTVLLTGAALIYIGNRWKKKSDIYYFRIFLVWLAIYGVVMVMLAIAELSGWVYDDVKASAVEALLGKVEVPAAFTSGFLWYGVVLLLCLGVAWISAMLAIGLLALATLFRWTKGDDEKSPRPVKLTPPLALIIVCAMAWLWTLVVAIIWVSVDKSGFFLKLLDKELLTKGVAQLVFALLGVGLMTVGVLTTLSKRTVWRKHFEGPSANINNVFAKHPVPRLLLSTGLVVGLLSTGFLLFAAITFDVIQLVAQGFGVGDSGQKTAVNERFGVVLSIAISIAAVIGGFAFTQRVGIAQALGVGKDLITYFKVEPTEKGKKPGDAQGEKMGVLSFPTNYDFNDFRQRRRIHGRMQKVLSAMCESENFDELIVISHSQGTIIATEFAKELQKRKGSLIGKDARSKLGPRMKEATLVTMGSPFTHVYNYYLPDEFGKPESIVKDDMIKGWINIFRVDDFIGTYIGAADLSGSWPKNHAVPPGGHTGYWTDRHVISHLQPLFNQPKDNAK